MNEPVLDSGRGGPIGSGRNQVLMIMAENTRFQRLRSEDEPRMGHPAFMLSYGASPRR